MAERPKNPGGSGRERLLAALQKRAGAADAAANVRADVTQAVGADNGTPGGEAEINTVNSVDYFVERCEQDPALDKAIERFGMVVALLKNLLRNKKKEEVILVKRLGLDPGDLMQKFIQMVTPLNRAIANPALLSRILQEPRDHFEILVHTVFGCEEEEDSREVDRHVASFMRFMNSPMHQKLIEMQEEGTLQKIMDLLQYMHENPDQTLEEAAVMNSFDLKPLPEKWRRLCLTAEELAAITARRRPAATPEPPAAGARHASPAPTPAPASSRSERRDLPERPVPAREVLDLAALESDPDLAEALGSLNELFAFFASTGRDIHKEEEIADQIDAALEARYGRAYPIGGELLAIERRGYHNILEILVAVFNCKNNTQLARAVNAVFAVISDLNLALPARPAARAAETGAQRALRLHDEALACHEIDLPRAIELAEEAVKLDPTLKNTWFNLGTFYEKSGSDRESLGNALLCYRQVLDLDPQDTEARKAHGRVHKKLYPDVIPSEAEGSEPEPERIPTPAPPAASSLPPRAAPRRRAPAAPRVQTPVSSRASVEGSAPAPEGDTRMGTVPPSAARPAPHVTVPRVTLAPDARAEIQGLEKLREALRNPAYEKLSTILYVCASQKPGSWAGLLNKTGLDELNEGDVKDIASLALGIPNEWIGTNNFWPNLYNKLGWREEHLPTLMEALSKELSPEVRAYRKKERKGKNPEIDLLNEAKGLDVSPWPRLQMDYGLQVYQSERLTEVVVEQYGSLFLNPAFNSSSQADVFQDLNGIAQTNPDIGDRILAFLALRTNGMPKLYHLLEAHDVIDTFTGYTNRSKDEVIAILKGTAPAPVVEPLAPVIKSSTPPVSWDDL